MPDKTKTYLRAAVVALVCGAALTACYQKPWEDFRKICEDRSGSVGGATGLECQCMANQLEPELTKAEFASLNELLEATPTRNLSSLVLNERLVNAKVSKIFARVVKACKQ